jgi:hypothetical protein
MISHFSRLVLPLCAATAICNLVPSAAACDVGCMPRGVALVYAPAAPAASDVVDAPQPKLSWVFKRSTFTNDPTTGARVAQYARKDPVEPLDDQRAVTSSYRRMRTELRGRDGSMDTTYVVQGWGTGGGDLGAQWQMFNDVWKEAILSGSFYNGAQAYGPWGQGGPGWGGGWQGGGGWNRGGWPPGGNHNRNGHWPSDDRAPLPVPE